MKNQKTLVPSQPIMLLVTGKTSVELQWVEPCEISNLRPLLSYKVAIFYDPS